MELLWKHWVYTTLYRVWTSYSLVSRAQYGFLAARTAELYQRFHCLRFDVNAILTPAATTPDLHTPFPEAFPVDLRFFKSFQMIFLGGHTDR